MIKSKPPNYVTSYFNKYECSTMDQEVELADAAAYAPGRRCVCTDQMVALFCVKSRRGRQS